MFFDFANFGVEILENKSELFEMNCFELFFSWQMMLFSGEVRIFLTHLSYNSCEVTKHSDVEIFMLCKIFKCCKSLGHADSKFKLMTCFKISWKLRTQIILILVFINFSNKHIHLNAKINPSFKMSAFIYSHFLYIMC